MLSARPNYYPADALFVIITPLLLHKLIKRGKEVRNMKFKRIAAAAAAFVIALFVFGAAAGAEAVPDEIRLVSGEKACLSRNRCIRLKYDNDETVKTSGGDGKSTAWANAFGVIPLKPVSISFVERESVILCAAPIGVRIFTEGVVVSETTEVITPDGSVDPGRECGLQAGDVILEADGKRLDSASRLIDAVTASDGRRMKLRVCGADGKEKTLYLRPVYSEADGCYRAGIWIRNSTAGIGVLTFYEPETMTFGGLGHAICDESSGAVMSVSDGEITNVMLTETVRGASGAPGELVGFLGEEKYGTLTQNTESGIYGIIDRTDIGAGEYEVALKQELREGEAQLLADVPGGGGKQLYDISIEKINYDSSNPTRNMIIRVTDERLLELTGGIVQGMSGSPIIQDGRFAAAVTHVFVNDPSMGYAVFAENMLYTAKSVIESTESAA